MICRTAAEAFAAGMADDCDHGLVPTECPACRLTPSEVSALAVLYRPPTTEATQPTHRAA
ncbi:hypothetical protein [Streptomyces sp. DH8]|uniref:hypothetical protein n=1 Tax=Streptomyces sp. DH8 TaxID=2857008 RepID=UPI001E4D7AE9|nr:hypothetical protein [Streptomyces sp. DH8]